MTNPTSRASRRVADEAIIVSIVTERFVFHDTQSTVAEIAVAAGLSEARVRSLLSVEPAELHSEQETRESKGGAYSNYVGSRFHKVTVYRPTLAYVTERLRVAWAKTRRADER